MRLEVTHRDANLSVLFTVHRDITSTLVISILMKSVAKRGCWTYSVCWSQEDRIVRIDDVCWSQEDRIFRIDDLADFTHSGGSNTDDLAESTHSGESNRKRSCKDEIGQSVLSQIRSQISNRHSRIARSSAP